MPSAAESQQKRHGKNGGKSAAKRRRISGKTAAVDSLKTATWMWSQQQHCCGVSNSIAVK
jgi:hypothetical protein